MQISKLEELKNRLSLIIPIESIDIKKLYDEILSFFSESIDDFTLRRHKELKSEGYKNIEIYSIIQKDILNHLFKGKKLSERQIKRIIYKD